MDRCNVGSERTSGSIGVSSGTARTSSAITKGPAVRGVWGRSSRGPGGEGRADCKLRRIRTDDQDRSKGRSNTEGNRRGSIDGENIRGSDRGGERPASGVGVGSRAAGTNSCIAKVPSASRSAHTARGSGGEGEALSNYRVRRTSSHSHRQFGADSYGGAVCRGHAQSISRGHNGCECSSTRVGVACGTCVSGTAISKGPLASRCAKTTCSGRCKADRNANLDWIRSSDCGYGQPRIDSY